MTHFWLARHGETEWNEEGRFQGQANPPLNEKGLAQAHQLANFLAEEEIQALYCSDLQRAVQTARIIGEKLGLELQYDKRLREINLGEWEGMLKSQIKIDYPEIWEKRQLDPVHVRAPGGENLLELAERVWAAADQIARKNIAGKILLVSHGVSLACLICRAHDMPLGKAFEVIPNNAHPVQIEWPLDNMEQLKTVVG
jgi:broad specificity phosphatase PhoE